MKCGICANYFFIFFLFTQILTVSYCVHVKVEQGELKGKRESRITDNGEYLSFKGIPYAAPPIGELRFKDPQPPLSWTKVRDARSHGAICPQNNINTGGNVTGDEDCLFLNVYTPTLTPETPLPVMFFIHGGYYVTGSGNDDRFGPDFLMDRDVVLVTINYRLGVLGFLSLDIPEAPGNVGLKDQVAAMEWVKKNIANFGGDPDNVTIFGQSVGGSAVTLHLLSPLSRGLFKRAIAMSGSFFKDFQLPFEHVRRAFLLTKQLGKCTKDPNEALRHLQQASVNDLIQAKPFVLYNERPRRELLEIMFFRPIIEKPMESGNFLTEDPMKLLIDRKVNEVDFIFGHTGEEGVYRGVTQKDYLLKYDPEYNEFLVPVTIANANSASEVLNIGTKIRQHYFTECEIKDDTKNMKEIIKFYTDFTYNHHFYRFLELWVQGGFKVYFYVFTGYTERNVYGKLGNIYGFENATHADDLAYLFSGSAYPTLQKENPSYQIIEQTCDLYTNFAKYGKPTPNDTVWLPYDKENTNYLLIDLELTPKILGEAPVVQFWRKIYEDAGLKFAT
ncbi:juvenile hormone esterase-like [Spodoptera frugiperda]|uniref:Juvenile hormone esterase-like n=1 Tax=Spodoptera frugiperda TaxID=7108 RepID=A0A9R0EQE1_SPOFR|nr:juvenile hormone esterase-like [Spodoptera frugiperda]